MTPASDIREAVLGRTERSTSRCSSAASGSATSKRCSRRSTSFDAKRQPTSCPGAARRTGVLVYSPMEVGLLTGRFTRDSVEALPPDDYRREHHAFREPALSSNLALVERLRALADRLGCSRSALTVAWTLARSGVTAAIVGALHPWQVDSWVRAGAIDLTPGDLHETARAVDETQAGNGPSLSARGRSCRVR